MSKRGYFRGDIYWANLEEINQETHMVVIISGWKCLLKNNKVQVCLITSKEKEYNRTHIRLDKEKFNLKYDSIVACENIHTISKKSLGDRVNRIDNITMLKIDECLKEQMQLENKYGQLDSKELETLFLENNSKLNVQKTELQELKNKLYFAQDDYDKALLLSYKLKDKAEKSKINDKNSYIWYALYVKANINLKLRNYKESLEDIEAAITFITNPTNYDLNYSLSLWLMARCYSELNEINKAAKIYNVLIKYYKSVNDVNMRISCMFNLCLLKKSKLNIRRLINIMENVRCSNINVFNMDEQKKILIKQMQDEYNTL